MKLTILLSALATLSIPSPATAPSEDCTGCAFIDAQPSESMTCAIQPHGEDCTIYVWAVMDNQMEDCGASGLGCASAHCKFKWSLRYRTEGTCEGVEWTLSRLSPEGTDLTLPANSTGRDIKIVNFDELCGQTENYEYKVEWVPQYCSGEIHIDEDLGCSNCMSVGQ